MPPSGSAFQGIARLDPGHKLVLEAGRIRIERFHRYSPVPKAEFANSEEAVDQLDTLLREVIAEHMISDVPLGAFLSGGIDSGLMVALMDRVRREAGSAQPIRTFTIGFGEEGRL